MLSKYTLFSNRDLIEWWWSAKQRRDVTRPAADAHNTVVDRHHLGGAEPIRGKTSRATSTLAMTTVNMNDAYS